MKAYEKERIDCGQLMQCYLTGNQIFFYINNHEIIHFSYLKKQWCIMSFFVMHNASGTIQFATRANAILGTIIQAPWYY